MFQPSHDKIAYLDMFKKVEDFSDQNDGTSNHCQIGGFVLSRLYSIHLSVFLEIKIADRHKRDQFHEHWNNQFLTSWKLLEYVWGEQRGLYDYIINGMKNWLNELNAVNE